MAVVKTWSFEDESYETVRKERDELREVLAGIVGTVQRCGVDLCNAPVTKHDRVPPYYRCDKHAGPESDTSDTWAAEWLRRASSLLKGPER